MSAGSVRNTRVSIQRLSDARLYRGWVISIPMPEFSVLFNEDIPDESGRKFYVEICGVEHKLMAEAELVALERNLGRFVMTQHPKYASVSEDARVRVSGLKGALESMGQQLDVDIVDISKNGIGLLSLAPLEKGSQIEFVMMAEGFPVRACCEVRYCTEKKDSTGLFRVGLLILTMGRLDRAAWYRLIKSRLG